MSVTAGWSWFLTLFRTLEIQSQGRSQGSKNSFLGIVVQRVLPIRDGTGAGWGE